METLDPSADFGRVRFSPPSLLDPYPLYKSLRLKPGLVFSPALGMWLVSRYQDVVSVLRAPTQFSSQQILRPTGERPPEVQALLDANGYSPQLPLLGDDPPNHGRLRSLVGKTFTPQRVAALEPRIRAWIAERLGGFSRTAEPIAQLAIPLPMRVMCELIGVPEADLPRVKEFGEASALFQSGRLPTEALLACAQKVIDYRHYVRALVAAKKERGGKDLISALLAAHEQEPGGSKLSAEEVMGLCVLFIFAGHQTTTALIANSLLHLIRRPAIWQALGDDEALRARAVEEVLRFDAPVQAMVRTTTAAVRLAETELPAQARLLVLFAAANHDEQVFAAPEEFDVDRKNADEQLSFGRGIHFCAGAALARLEARLVLEALSKRFPGARLAADAPLEYTPNLIHRTPQRLQVIWE